MKRMLILIFAFTYVVGALAQGTIYFANDLQFPVYTNNGISTYGYASQNSFHVALYWGTLGSTEAQLVQIGSAVGGTADGVFNGGVYTTPNGTAPGANAVFEVRGWTGNYSTYELALAAAASNPAVEVDTSGIWVNPTGLNAGAPAAMLLGPTGFKRLFLSASVVPEPAATTMAAMLGAMILIMLQRRK